MARLNASGGHIWSRAQRWVSKSCFLLQSCKLGLSLSLQSDQRCLCPSLLPAGQCFDPKKPREGQHSTLGIAAKPQEAAESTA